MKFLVRCTVLSSILSTYSCSAFSSPSVSSELTRTQSQKNIQQSFLPSTLIDAADTTISSSSQSIEQTMQQQIDAQQKKVAASYLDDGFVFGLDGSGLERPKGKEANVVVEGDSLETTPQQIGIVFSTFFGQFLIALNAISQYLAQTDGNVELTAFTSLSVIVASWVLADFGSGVFHWSVDNYGNGRTPVMGSIIAAFQGHHSAPWTITYRGFCNNVWKLCIPFGLPTVAAISYIAGPENSMGKSSVSFHHNLSCVMMRLSVQSLTKSQLFNRSDSLLHLLLCNRDHVSRTSQVEPHDKERDTSLCKHTASSRRHYCTGTTCTTSSCSL